MPRRTLPHLSAFDNEAMPEPDPAALLARLDISPLSRIDSRSVQWLWRPYLPRGKVVILDGDPGIGKSLLMVDLAARLSRGGPLPDAAPGERPQTVLLLNAEDDAADTIRPRAEAAGADLERLIVVATKVGSPILLPQQLGEFTVLTRATKADLVVLDPFAAFIESSQSEACVHRVLTSLQFLAEKLGCTIVLIRHLRKQRAAKGIHRGLGSIRIIGKARIALLASRHPIDSGQGVLAITKTNIAGPAPALGYRIKASEAGPAMVEWTGIVEAIADDLDHVAGPILPRDRASSWLQEQLSHGPRKAADVFEAATAAGIPERTLKRAKAELDVRVHRVSHKGQEGWFWYDPAAAWPEDAPFKKPFEPATPMDDWMG